MKHLTVAQLTLGVAMLVVALRLLAPSWLETLDLRLLDLRQVARGTLAPGGETVVVGVDERSLDEVGRWPWPRARIASLVERLSADGASAIGFDMVFDQPDMSVNVAGLRAAVASDPHQPAGDLLDRVALEQDTRLAAALRASGRVVLGYYVDLSGVAASDLASAAAHLPEMSVRASGGAELAKVGRIPVATRLHAAIPVLATSSAGAGHFNFLPDADGLYRRLPVVIRIADQPRPALALEMVRRHLGGASATLDLAPDGVRAVRVGTLAPPVDAGGQMWITYLGPARTFPIVSAADVLHERVPPGTFTGKLVLVGFTAAGFDEITTPFTAVQPGVELQATVIDDLLHERVLRRPWWVVPGEVAVILACGVVLALALRHQRTGAGALAAVILAVLYLWGTQQLFVHAHLALGAIYPLLAIATCTLGGSMFRVVVEEREKRRIREAFGHYLNPEVTDMLARDPSRLRLGGERREVTVFFSDIRGFTTISEQLDAGALAELLNEYLGAMTDVVFRHEGLLDKYVGDELVALWGAPLDAPDHARRCCNAALEMLERLAALHDRWRSVGLPIIEIGIGISSGLAAVGNFGSAQRFSYTAVGDTVNLASRLQGLNKEYATRILVSESTRIAAGDDFIYREVDRVQVRGRAKPVTIHELLGRCDGDGKGTLLRRAMVFESALGAFRRQAWDQAIAQLDALAAEHPDDRAAVAFRLRCERLRDAPAGAPGTPG